MKQAADKKRSDVEFQVGDNVLLKLQPYVHSSVVSRPYPKLAMKYFGPYKVLAQIGRTSYTLDLPDTSQIHPTLLVSHLKAFVPDFTPVVSTLPSSLELTGDQMVPEGIVDRRLVKKGNKAVPQVLIK